MEGLVQRISMLEQGMQKLLGDNHCLRCRLTAVEAFIPALQDPRNCGHVLHDSGKVVGPALKDQKLAWIPFDVGSVGAKAFQGCEQLAQIIFPESGMLTAIESKAFQGCRQLMSARIPPSVVEIGSEAFYESALASVEFSSNGRLQILGENAFRCTNLQAVVIPASVQTIGHDAFFSCGRLVKVEFGAGSRLRTLDRYAFQRTNISSFTLPPAVTAISLGLFEGCRSLAMVQLSGNGLQSIGELAFCGCVSLRCVCLATDGASPAHDRLQLAGISLESIGERAFEGCSGFKEATFPASLVSVGSSAFRHCAGLAKVTFAGAALQHVPPDAFEGCSALREVKLPTSVEEVHGGTFRLARLTRV
jgi:hypothetical protein